MSAMPRQFTLCRKTELSNSFHNRSARIHEKTLCINKVLVEYIYVHKIHVHGLVTLFRFAWTNFHVFSGFFPVIIIDPRSDLEADMDSLFSWCSVLRAAHEKMKNIYSVRVVECT